MEDFSLLQNDDGFDELEYLSPSISTFYASFV